MEGTPRSREGERQASQEVGGPGPQPDLNTALLPGVLNKRRNSYNLRGGVVPFIHNIVNIYGPVITCASVWCLHVCLSICQAGGWISGDLLDYLPFLLPPHSHPGNGTWNRYGPTSWWDPAGRA